MRRLIPLLIVLLALAGGAGAGFYLQPRADACADGAAGPDGGDAPASPAKDDAACKKPEASAAPETASAFADLKRQFVVPLISGERVAALVVASLSLEVAEGATEPVFAREPKLRDAFLDVLFAHAHGGGFDGAFTSRTAMADLKARLVEVARPIVGPALRDVLITEIVRQDL